MNSITWKGVTRPWERPLLVLGFSASNLRSAQRLNPMAADRAPAMATTIQSICLPVGSPLPRAPRR